jgi:signal transduction histidine kinase/CheY-like chemotaxis protein
MNGTKMQRRWSEVKVPAAIETAGVVVDDRLNILQFLGHTAAYLQLPSGKARFNLLPMVRPGLQRALFSAIQQARDGHGPERRHGVLYSVRDETRKVNIEVSRVEQQGLGEFVFWIVFEDATPPREKSLTQGGVEVEIAAEAAEQPAGGGRFVDLQEQLLRAKENLRAMVYDHGAAVRNLAHSNNALEITSAELEAVNAELEAYNDELETVNHDLKTALAQRDEAERERKRLEQQVLHAEKLKSLGILAGGIAHDFKNLLTAILGFAGLALEDIGPESAARSSIDEVVAAAERAAELTRQMLACSGQGKFKVEPVDLSRVVQDMGHLLRISVSKKVALKYDLAEDLPLFEADPGQLQQVAMNLVANASDAIGTADGMIRVTTGVMAADRDYLSKTYVDDQLPAGDYVYIEVSDSGCGMDGATAARIFEPFFTTKDSGRGLGLAAVLGIVRGHRGAIKLAALRGSGTAFRVLFPSAKEPAVESPIALRTLAAPPARGTILVVDDEESVRTVAVKILEKHGFTVAAATDGRHALDIFRNCPDAIAAVLLDLTMPHMDGGETFRALRSIRPDVRIILSSGYDQQDTVRHLAGPGPAGFIQKPYRSSELVPVVRRVLNGPSGYLAATAAIR